MTDFIPEMSKKFTSRLAALADKVKDNRSNKYNRFTDENDDGILKNAVADPTAQQESTTRPRRWTFSTTDFVSNENASYKAAMYMGSMARYYDGNSNRKRVNSKKVSFKGWLVLKKL